MGGRREEGMEGLDGGRDGEMEGDKEGGMEDV